MPKGASWVRIAGDGLVYQGRCVLLGLLWRSDKNDHECAIYDGIDATSGRPFHELIGDADKDYSRSFGRGVEMSSGIYVDQTTTSDILTVYFEPGEL